MAGWELLALGFSQTDVAAQTEMSRVMVGRADKVLKHGTGIVKTVLERLGVEKR